MLRTQRHLACGHVGADDIDVSGRLAAIRVNAARNEGSGTACRDSGTGMRGAILGQGLLALAGTPRECQRRTGCRTGSAHQRAARIECVARRRHAPQCSGTAVLALAGGIDLVASIDGRADGAARHPQRKAALLDLVGLVMMPGSLCGFDGDISRYPGDVLRGQQFAARDL
ncbi:hypothetical protein D9M68_477600 [compost metagenome]